MLELSAKLDLSDVVVSNNIATELSKSDLLKIGADVCRWYKTDKDSRRVWEADTQKVIELAKLEHTIKDTPYPNCSNIKHPITTVATQQFAARAYQELVKDGRVLGIDVIGRDSDGAKEARATRVDQFMNWQLLTESTAFEESLDKLLHTLPLVGMAFKKTYYDPIKRVNVSELCPYNEIFINNDVKSLEDARHITHKLDKHANYIIEKIRYGHYVKLPKAKLDTSGMYNEGSETHVLLEQHTYLDLDGDGYEEPYIVTVLEKTQDVLRIMPRFTSDKVEMNYKNEVQCIHPIQYFTAFTFVPNPDGSFYGIGIGHMLFGLNEAINTLINQLVDAGRFGNMPTGILGRDLRIKGGELKIRPGLFIKLDTALTGPIKDSIHMFDFKEPSPVLFQLLGMLIEGAKELASINETNTGSAQVQNVAQSVMASQLSQGMKVYSGIQRRMFRGLKQEFEKLYELNSVFLDPQKYVSVLGVDLAISKDDFDLSSYAVTPVADLSTSSDTERIQRADMVMKLADDPAFGPIINKFEALSRYFEDLRMPAPERLMIPPDPNAPPPPAILELQSKIQQAAAQEQTDQADLQLRQQDIMIRAHHAQAEIEKLQAEAYLALAQAAAAAQAPEIDKRKQDMDVIMGAHKGAVDLQKEDVKAKAKPKPKTGA